MTGLQTILIIVVVSLTVLLVVVGVQVIFIILDLRRALRRLNSLMDDAILGGGLIRPDKLTTIFEMFRRKKEVTGHGQNQV